MRSDDYCVPNCADVPEVCDTSPCADYLQAYSINTWTTQGAGSWREPDWPNCDNSLPDPLFDYEERCVWTASLFVHRTGGVVDTCTSLLVGIAWMRKADQSVTIGAWATAPEPSEVSSYCRPEAVVMMAMAVFPFMGVRRMVAGLPGRMVMVVMPMVMVVFIAVIVIVIMVMIVIVCFGDRHRAADRQRNRFNLVAVRHGR